MTFTGYKYFRPKVFLFFVLFSFPFMISFGQDPFVTTWEWVSIFSSDEITIPTFPGEVYNYDVDWENDGTYDDFNVTGDITHDYGDDGTYTIAIRGTFPRIYFANLDDEIAGRLKSIDQWGDISWSSMKGAFMGCDNLTIQAADNPDLSNVIDMRSMFSWDNQVVRGNFSGDLSNWDVSNVRRMDSLFYNVRFSSENITDISTWNVGNVVSLSSMFDGDLLGVPNFNGDLSTWDVSNVENMSKMFWNAFAFNSNISNWDVSSVTSMTRMFQNARSFNQDLSDWNVSNVRDMSFMFSDADTFQGDLSEWNVSNVTSLESMFGFAASFSSDLSNWNTSKVTNMSRMFSFASAFSSDLSGWDFSNVIDMDDMLRESGMSVTHYDSVLLAWNNGTTPNNVSLNSTGLNYCDSESARQSLIDNKGWTFVGDSKECPVNGDAFITTWKTDNPGASNSTSITIPTFSGETYNYDVDWDNDGTFDEFGLTGNVTHDFGIAGTYTVAIQGDFPRIYFNNGGDRRKIVSVEQWGNIAWSSMNSAFFNCSNLNINATDNPDLSNVADMFKMFIDVRAFNTTMNNWDVSNVTNMFELFKNSPATTFQIEDWDVSNVTNMSGMFSGAESFNTDLNNWTVSNVTDMSGMFSLARAFNGDLNNWDVSNVTNMAQMFTSAISFNGDISNWNVQNVTNMADMFSGATVFEGNIGSWDVSNVRDMSQMFGVTRLFNSDISNWDVSKVTNMHRMFFGTEVFNVNIGNWNVSSVTNMDNMFGLSKKFNQNIGNWNVSNVDSISGMFDRAEAFNQDVSNWDIRKVSSLVKVFSAATSFNQNLGEWDISNVNNMTGLLSNSALSRKNYDLTIKGWQSQNVPNNLTLGANGLNFCSSEAERQILIDDNNWNFVGDNKNCFCDLSSDKGQLDEFWNEMSQPNLTNWNSNAELADWQGIDADTLICGVTELNISEPNVLNGTIQSQEDLNLKELTILSLVDQQDLTGNIPDFSSLPSLTKLILENNDLSGSLPNFSNIPLLMDLDISHNRLSLDLPIFDNLSKLEHLDLSFNNYSGPIPNFASLISLKTINLDGNNFVFPGGKIDLNSMGLDNVIVFSGRATNATGDAEDFSGTADLQRIDMGENNLHGTLPTFSESPNVRTILVDNNRIDSIPPLDPAISLDTFHIQNNQLTFDDVLTNFANNEYIYSPQDSVGEAVHVTKALGESHTIDLQIDGSLSTNEYKWLKDGQPYQTTTENRLGFEALSEEDAGTYTCEIRNSNAPDLVLYSRPVTLNNFVGVSTKNIYKEIKIVPNPGKENIQITFTLKKSADIEIDLLDINGRKLLDLKNMQNFKSGTHLVELRLNQKLKLGMYFILLKSELGNKMERLLID